MTRQTSSGILRITGPRVSGIVLMVAALRGVPPAWAEALVLDFEPFSEGTPVEDRFLPDGVSMTVLNNGGGPNVAIVFDSACPGGCSGGDTDLQTPGAGAGNDVAQNHVLVIAEDVVDAHPEDGAVDDPDDEHGGGSIRWFFDPPRRVASLRVIDIDTKETTGFAQIALADGGFATAHFLALGDNSAQTVVFPDAPLANSLRVFLPGSGAIDDIVLDEPPPSSSTTSLPEGSSTTLPETSTTIAPGTTSTTLVTTTTIASGLCGDVTGDGRVTVADAGYVLNDAVNALFACPVETCDVDASGSVEVSDALTILRLAVGLRADSICAPADAS